MSDSATPWTVASQAPLFMGFSRQEYWRGLLCPPPGDLPDPGIKTHLVHRRQILYHLNHQGSDQTLGHQKPQKIFWDPQHKGACTNTPSVQSHDKQYRLKTLSFTGQRGPKTKIWLRAMSTRFQASAKLSWSGADAFVPGRQETGQFSPHSWTVEGCGGRAWAGSMGFHRLAQHLTLFSGPWVTQYFQRAGWEEDGGNLFPCQERGFCFQEEKRRKPRTPVSYSARGQGPWGHPDTCQARSRGAAPPDQRGAQSRVPAPTAGRPAQYHQEAGPMGTPAPSSGGGRWPLKQPGGSLSLGESGKLTEHCETQGSQMKNHFMLTLSELKPVMS